MKKQNAFTLVEILVAIAISSLIMVALQQSLQNTFRFISTSDRLISVDEKISLFFNQLENDLSSAFIPSLEKEIKQESDAKSKKDALQNKAISPEAKNTAEKKDDAKKNDKTNYFIAKVKEDVVIPGVSGLKKGQKMFDSLNFISTNPLTVYGSPQVHLVRVSYELVLNKEHSDEDKQSYDLFRKETTDLANIKLKKSEEISRKKDVADVYSYVIATNIKELYIEYGCKLETKKKIEETTKEDREMERFVWGDDDKTKNILPHYANVSVVFWNDKKTREYKIDTFISILSGMDKIENKRVVKKVAPLKSNKKEDAKEVQAKPSGSLQPKPLQKKQVVKSN